MKVFVALLLSVCVYQVSALRLWGWLSDDDADTDDVIQGMAEITDECLQLASWGQCDFYDCLEDRFPCGDEGYTNRISKHFCGAIDRSFNTFDDFGKRWLNHTSICLLSYFTPIYQQESTSCEDIKNAGIRAIIECNGRTFEGRNFCEFLNTNGQAYNNLMGRQEVMLMASLRNTEVIRSMVYQAVECGVQNLRGMATSLSQYAGSMFSSVRDWFS